MKNINQKPSNPNAFPTRTEYEDPTNPIFSGMTLRDYFAAKAMQAMIQREHVSAGWSENESAQCYIIADMMLKQRGI